MRVRIENLIDPEILLEINNAAVPDVNRLEPAGARWLLAHAAVAKLAVVDGRPAGVLVALSESAGYNSGYFGWFSHRYSNFIYIDRVIVSAWARRLGLAAELYRQVDQAAAEKGLAIATDVYSEPPNAASLAFHAKMGFAEVGLQFSELEKKTVAKLLKFPERARRKGES